jgi:hypothetical protein
VADPSHVFVHWDCHGTNLQPTVDENGKPHKPTFHESHISGIDILTFTEDRSKIEEIVIYRYETFSLAWSDGSAMWPMFSLLYHSI